MTPLGDFLVSLGRAARASTWSVAQDLRIGEAELRRYESGEQRPTWSFVQSLVTYYSATPEQLAEAKRLWAASR